MEKRIGVALSGGGYRAAAWSLGTLLYLADARLSQDVVTVSSVSGGSITNAASGLRRFEKMTPKEAWEFSAWLGRLLTGSVAAFVVVLVVHIVVWSAVVALAAIHSVLLSAALLGGGVLLSGVIGSAPGDATFGSRITWWYLDALSAALALLAFSIGEGWWWAAALTVAVVLSLRGVVVGWALEWRVLREPRSPRPRLEDLSNTIDHVLCACDLHGRHHVYFGRDFVYSYGLGLGSRPRLALSAAVQSSANLPFAFPPRTMAPAPFGFTKGRYRAHLLALTDGGVYDNMADEWLLSFGERAERLRKRASEIEDHQQRETLQAAAARLSARQPNFVVVANASGPLGFKFAWTTAIPLIGELLSLLRVKSILYDNGNTTRRRLLVDRFIGRTVAGILVHISTDPWSVINDARHAGDVAVQRRAEAAAEALRKTPGLEPERTKTPAGAATVLYPLSAARIAALLQRSYALACIQGHVWYDLPWVDVPPLAWFAALAAGRVEARSAPPHLITEPTSVETLEPGKSVPVVVDAVRDIEGNRMARMTYFVVASVVPEPMWQLDPGPASQYSLEALGLVGVICGPDRRTALFRLEGEIGALFQDIESNEDLSVELEDVWVPLDWFSPGTNPERGQVYRLRLDAFREAYRFRSEEATAAHLVEAAPSGGAIYSPEETNAFREWAKSQITEARSAYPKDETLALSYREGPE